MPRLEHISVAPLRQTILATCIAAALGCGTPQAPDSLVELRQSVAGEPIVTGRAAAPDLVAEAERSLTLAEEALGRRAVADARRLSTLGNIQIRTATAIARQRAAEERLVAARRSLAVSEEDLARFTSERQDALAEVERLEGLRGASEEEDE